MTARPRTTLAALATAVAVALLLAGCGGSETRPVAPTTDNPFDGYGVGRDDAFEAVTWNLRYFAENADAEEVALVAEAILALEADVVAVQEIREPERFDELVALLPHHSGFRSPPDYLDLGFIWIDSTVAVRAQAELRPQAEGAGDVFYRWPLVLEITWQGHDLALVNNHLKCCGDGRLDPDDPGDEETIRLRASEILADHLQTAYAGQAAILLGDLNDLLDDEPEHNVFMPFLEDPATFRFADMDLATGPVGGWSWGPGRSHLDHILVTAPLFAALEAAGARCVTVRLDRALAGDAYLDKMSDHVPVALVLPGAALP